MFKYEIIDLPKIAIIGREGLCTKEKNTVQELWQQANANFSDVADIGMKNADGSYTGFWGAMSDETRSFMPWTDNFTRGLYLAGVEVYEDTAAPAGWVKWVMPARKYLVTEVTPESYGETFGTVLNKLIPELGMKLAGAACDFTEPATGQNKLFFPIMEDCVFCKIGSGEIQGLRICEDDEALAFMDISKDYDGHILVIPKKHFRYVTDCPENVACKVWSMVQKVSKHLMEDCGYDGADIMSANSPVSQSLPHFHVHIIPRKNGDQLGNPGEWPAPAGAKEDVRDMYEKLKMI